jgi:hypothetical protein
VREKFILEPGALAAALDLPKLGRTILFSARTSF